MRIAVASGKGGTGKTTFCVNLAYALSGRGERIRLLDCDVEEPNAALFLKPVLSQREQTGILHGLATGEIDIVVGTHRLISGNVQFKDLGLVIVDEEQRFGVRHKEWLKQMRQQVDVLTLSATPIPRTLGMARA